MDPRHLFIDERLTGICVYCGGQSDTKDHVPSKVLLDKPYPPQLPMLVPVKTVTNLFRWMNSILHVL